MEEKKTISNAEKRWIVREIESGRMTIGEAQERIKFMSKSPRTLIIHWRKRFAPEISFTLPIMTENEKRKFDAAQKRIKEFDTKEMTIDGVWKHVEHDWKSVDNSWKHFEHDWKSVDDSWKHFVHDWKSVDDSWKHYEHDWKSVGGGWKHFAHDWKLVDNNWKNIYNDWSGNA